MKKLTLKRIAFWQAWTFGVLIDDLRPFAVTLELPWKDNATDISCIPAGTYQAKRIFSGRFQTLLFTLVNVPGRGNIELHMGNTVQDTHGCILLGQSFTWDAPGISNSRIAFENFMRAYKDDFELEVING